jgi:hypothetical protein
VCSSDLGISGKATLAAQDVRFARTIERIQRTVVSELYKIAIVHLASQGIEDSEMTNFQLTLTNSSTIYEQEKVNLWSEKVRLATDIKGMNMLSTDWVYHNVFSMSEDEMDMERAKMVLDLKDRFRHTSIEQQGQDPANPPQQQNVEEEIEKMKQEIVDKGGRPREGNTYGKDKHPLGRDPLGNKENEKERKRETRAFESNKRVAKEYINGVSAKKKILSEKSGLLDEKNILDDTKF